MRRVMMRHVDTRQIELAIERAKRGVGQYLEIMELWPRVNVAEDRGFQRKFNAFYRVRQRPVAWYAAYYGCMQECRMVRPAPTFDDVLDHLWRVLGRCEPSFASKLVATIDPERPVWDAFVLENTGVKPPAHAAANRLARVKLAYWEIQDWYRRFLASCEGRALVETFCRMVPEHQRITDLKKVDFVLWQTREREEVECGK